MLFFLFLVITASKEYINAAFFCRLGKEDKKHTKCLHICDGRHFYHMDSYMNVQEIYLCLSNSRYKY